MLQAADRGNSVGRYGPAPLELLQVKYQEVIEPVFPIPSSEDEHLIVNDRSSMKLAHGGLASNDARDIECQLVHAFPEVNVYHIGKHREPVPASVYDDVAPVPELARVAHAWLGQLVLINLGLVPLGFLYRHELDRLRTSIEDEYVIHNSLFPVALAPSEDD